MPQSLESNFGDCFVQSSVEARFGPGRHAGGGEDAKHGPLFLKRRNRLHGFVIRLSKLLSRPRSSLRLERDSALVAFNPCEMAAEAFATEFTKALNHLEVPFEMTGCHKKRAPCGPKPTALRPVRARKLRVPAEEQRANTFVKDLIDGALEEEVDVAEDVTYYDESDEDIEDEVVSLTDPSDDEEEESLGFATVVAERVFHEAFLQDMRMEESVEDVDAEDDFEEDFVEVEEAGDEFVMQQSVEHLCAKLGTTVAQAACGGTGRGTLAQAQTLTLSRKKSEIDVQAIEALRQQARSTLVRAAQDGSLGKALQEAQVETLRVETRDCLLAAARDGRLAAALHTMATREDSPEETRAKAVANTLAEALTQPEPAEQAVKETHAMSDLPFYLCPSVGTWLNPLPFPVQVTTKPEPVEQPTSGVISDLRATCRTKRRIIGAVVRAPTESLPEDPRTSATSPKSNRPWVMAGSPAAGLRFKEPRKESDPNPEGAKSSKSSIAAMFEAMGSTELYRTDEKFPVGKLTMPGMLKSASAGSVSAFALDLGTTVSSQKVLATPFTSSRCSSVGALRSLKAEKAGKPGGMHGFALPFLQKSGNHLPHVMPKKMQAWCSAPSTTLQMK